MPGNGQNYLNGAPNGTRGASTVPPSRFGGNIDVTILLIPFVSLLGTAVQPKMGRLHRIFAAYRLLVTGACLC